MENILVPVSPGEVLDKITILEIKSERIHEEDKLLNVRRELSLLQETWTQKVVEDKNIRRYVYFTNDRRSRVKKELNTYLGSEIVEEKSYKDYQ